jgi:hypothetical protein
MAGNFNPLQPGLLANVRGCIQKFPDWPPGARTANGTALPLGAVVSLFCELV